ncbi:hypothetical protein ACN47E_006965 [Coniothyrium glycines]
MVYAELITAVLAVNGTLIPRQRESGRNCPSVPRCPAWDGCISTADSGAQYQIKCSTDYNGPIIAVEHSEIFSDCSNACATYPGCNGFNQKGNFCYLLGANIGGARSASDVIAATLTRAATSSPSPAVPTCPNGPKCDNTDGCKYTSNNRDFIAACNRDFYGGDMAIEFTPDLTTCINKCANTAGCVVVTWWDGTCYLKSSKQPAFFNNYVDSAYVQ